jgi:hypothetical protein
MVCLRYVTVNTLYIGDNKDDDDDDDDNNNNKHSRGDWKSMALVYVLTATHLSGTDVIVNLPHGLLTETGSLDVTGCIHMASLISTEGHGSMNENRRYSGSCHLLLAKERNFHHYLSAVVTR